MGHGPQTWVLLIKIVQCIKRFVCHYNRMPEYFQDWLSCAALLFVFEFVFASDNVCLLLEAFCWTGNPARWVTAYVHVLGICTWAATEQFPSLVFPFFSAFPCFTRFWVNWVSTGNFAGASFSLFFYPVKLIGFVRFNCWQGNAGKLFMRIGANFNVGRLTIR